MSLGLPGKIAYVTHVPSGSQAVLDHQGQVIERYDGRGDGPTRLEKVLQDGAAMVRVLANLQSEEDTQRRPSVITWVHFIKLSDITYLAKGSLAGPATVKGERTLTMKDLGAEIYRVAFKLDGNVGAGYRSQNGDAAYLDPGTPIYVVKDYAPRFRLATVSDGQVTLFEADTNPAARTGADLLDIQDRVRSIGIHSTGSGRPELASIGDPRLVEELIKLALAAPVDQGRRDREGEWYHVAFHLEDATAVVRSFWPDSGELSRGIMTPKSFRASILEALAEAGALPP